MPETSRAARVRQVAQSWPGITRVTGQRAPGNIAKSDRESEHTFGNALDIFGSRKAMAALAANLNANKSQYQIRIVCYDAGPGPKYDKCTTLHLDHIHVDFSPGCGGSVSPTGDGATRTRNCETHQGGGMTPDKPYEEWTTEEKDSFWQRVKANETPLNPVAGKIADALNPLSGVAEALTESVQKTVLILIGGGLVVAGVVLVVKDTELGKMAVGAVKTAVTKGAA